MLISTFSVSVFSFFFLLNRKYHFMNKNNDQFLIIHVLGIVCTFIMYKIFLVLYTFLCTDGYDTRVFRYVGTS